MANILATTFVLDFHMIQLLLLHVCMQVVLIKADIFYIPLHSSQWINNEAPRSNVGTIRHHHISRRTAPIDNLRGKPGLGFYIEVELGTPKHKFNVLVDTGSSNFAVAAAPNDLITTYFHNDESSTYRDLNKNVYVPYTQGEWRGPLGEDIVTVPSSHPNVSVTVNVASIIYSEEFFTNGSNWQGILGLAYADIARPDSSVTPFFDSFVDQSGVDDIFTLQLCGIAYPESNASKGSVSGSMTIGGVSSALYTGQMWYTSIRNDWYYEIIIMDIEVDGQSMEMDCKEYNFDRTIVDSGTTNLRLPTRVFETLKGYINQTVKKNIYKPVPDTFWTGDDLLCQRTAVDPWEWFPTLALIFNTTDSDTAFKLRISPRQYLRHVITDDPTENCYKYGISSSDTGTVLGAVVMEGFYVVFDRENQTIGFAKSSCTDLDLLLSAPAIEGPLPAVNKDCGYIAPDTENIILTTIAYVMAGLCIVCLIPIVVLYLHHYYRKFHAKLSRNNDSELLEERTDSTETDVLKQDTQNQQQGQEG